MDPAVSYKDRKSGMWAPAQDAATSETEVDTTSKAAPIAKRGGRADTVSEIGTLFILIGVGAAGIVATLSGHSNSFCGQRQCLEHPNTCLYDCGHCGPDVVCGL
jgi:hypothetical protein